MASDPIEVGGGSGKRNPNVRVRQAAADLAAELAIYLRARCCCSRQNRKERERNEGSSPQYHCKISTLTIIFRVAKPIGTTSMAPKRAQRPHRQSFFQRTTCALYQQACAFAVAQAQQAT
jgi:hypothetical protein